MSVVAGTVVIELPRAIVTTLRSSTHIPNSTALVPAFLAPASTITRSRSGSALGAERRTVWPIAVWASRKHSEKPRRHKGLVFMDRSCASLGDSEDCGWDDIVEPAKRHP